MIATVHPRPGPRHVVRPSVVMILHPLALPIPATSLGSWWNHLLESLGPGTKSFMSRVAFLAQKGGKSHMQPLASRALPTTCFYAWTPSYSCQLGCLLGGWCVGCGLEGSISALHSMCGSFSVCSISLVQHSRFSSKIKSVISGAKWYATQWSRAFWNPLLSPRALPHLSVSRESPFVLMWATTILTRPPTPHWKRWLLSTSPSSQ